MDGCDGAGKLRAAIAGRFVHAPVMLAIGVVWVCCAEFAGIGIKGTDANPGRRGQST